MKNFVTILTGSILAYLLYWFTKQSKSDSDIAKERVVLYGGGAGGATYYPSVVTPAVSTVPLVTSVSAPPTGTTSGTASPSGGGTASPSTGGGSSSSSGGGSSSSSSGGFTPSSPSTKIGPTTPRTVILTTSPLISTKKPTGTSGSSSPSIP